MGRLLALVLALALTGASPPAAADGAWEEIAWPFPRDAWPAGRAFRCPEAGCDLVVYVRPKLGFCNCAAGVTDDAEVDAVSDLDMLSAEFRPAAPGAPVRVGDLAGRARRYVLPVPEGEREAAGYALSSHCDLLVAVGVQQTTARPVGLSVRFRIRSAGTGRHCPPTNTS